MAPLYGDTVLRALVILLLLSLFINPSSGIYAYGRDELLLLRTTKIELSKEVHSRLRLMNILSDCNGPSNDRMTAQLIHNIVVDESGVSVVDS